jgi:hypothetical protein
VPTVVGACREHVRPGEPLPKPLAAGDLLTNCKICEKVRLGPRRCFSSKLDGAFEALNPSVRAQALNYQTATGAT